MSKRSKTTSALIGVVAILSVAAQARATTPITKCGTVIKTPGSYVLTKNLAVKKGGGTCITVSTNYVTLDLGGFTINCGGAKVDAINDKTINFQGIVIRNGSTTGCDNGINLDSKGVLIDGVSTISDKTGLFLGNAGNLVVDSISNDNNGSGGAFSGLGIFLECPTNAVNNTAVGNAFENIRTDQPGCILFNNLTP